MDRITPRFWIALAVTAVAAAQTAPPGGGTAPAAAPGKSYTYFLTGSADDARPRTSFGLLMAGGGGDVPEAWKWFLERAGHGDIVVLRASGGDGYNKYIPDLAQVDSVETLLFHDDRASHDAFVLERIRRADGLFFAGGDQWRYVDYWRGTPVEDAIHLLARKGVPIGGTSAGLAILGQYSFSAKHDTVVSSDALADPFGYRVMVERNFLKLPFLDNLITDSHFSRRDRMGRLLVFMARIQTAGAPEARGVGVDEATAVVVDAAGKGMVLGKGSAYFVRTSVAPSDCVAGKPLTHPEYGVHKIPPKGIFDIPLWSGPTGERYVLKVLAGKVLVPESRSYVY